MSTPTLALLVLLVLLSGCGDGPGPSGIDADLCATVDGAVVDDSYEFRIISDAIASDAPCLPEYSCWTGRLTNWQPSTGFVRLGPEEPAPSDPVPEDDPLGQLIFSIGDPDLTFGKCEAPVTSAVLSHTDRRVGTAPQLNAKRYDLVELDGGPCRGGSSDSWRPAGVATLDYIGEDAIRGALCIQMIQVAPDDPDAEPFLISGLFEVAVYR